MMSETARALTKEKIISILGFRNTTMISTALAKLKKLGQDVSGWETL
jgi:hypothetical protein